LPARPEQQSSVPHLLSAVLFSPGKIASIRPESAAIKLKDQLFDCTVTVI